MEIVGPPLGKRMRPGALLTSLTILAAIAFGTPSSLKAPTHAPRSTAQCALYKSPSKKTSPDRTQSPFPSACELRTAPPLPGTISGTRTGDATLGHPRICQLPTMPS
eukprot:5387996-Pyramimonas_sp.AAC.1